MAHIGKKFGLGDAGGFSLGLGRAELHHQAPLEEDHNPCTEHQERGQTDDKGLAPLHLLAQFKIAPKLVGYLPHGGAHALGGID